MSAATAMVSTTPSITSSPPLRAVEGMLSAARLPASDLTAAQLEHFFLCGSETAPTGLVGVELYGNVALLRSLVVAAHAHKVGLGTALVSHAERYARDKGVTHLYLLTTTAEAFFAKRGYARTSRDAGPAAIRATREFAGLCPDSSIFMLKRL